MAELGREFMSYVGFRFMFDTIFSPKMERCLDLGRYYWAMNQEMNKTWSTIIFVNRLIMLFLIVPQGFSSQVHTFLDDLHMALLLVVYASIQ
jgi:hypothetical protein